MSDTGSLVFYICSFLLSAFLYKLYCKHNKRIFLALAFLIPLLVGGLRYRVGTDYMNYYGYYKNAEYIDTGFYMLSSIARCFGDVQVMFFIYNALTLLFIFLGLGNINKKYRPLAYLCFLFLFFTTSFNAMRQMLAVGIVFFSYKYAIDKKVVPFVILIVIAMLFHSTALFGLILYPLLNLKRKSVKAVISIVALVIALNYQGFIGLISNISLFEHYSMYQTYSDGIEFSNTSFIVELFALGYVLFSKKRISADDKKFDKYLFIYLIGIILLSTGFYNPYLKRIALYFTISSIVLLPAIPCSCKIGKDKLVNQIIIIGFVISKFVIQAYFLGQSDIIPYNFVGL